MTRPRIETAQPAHATFPYLNDALPMNLKKSILALAFFPLAALAGKAEREYVTASVEPAVKEAAATLKKSCGCDVKFDFKADAYKDVDELRQITHAARAITEGAPRHCSDAPSKAAICKLKTAEFSRGATPEFKFAGGKGSIVSDTSSYPSWDMMTRELDK
jgi:hypothetical protein